MNDNEYSYETYTVDNDGPIDSWGDGPTDSWGIDPNDSWGIDPNDSWGVTDSDLSEINYWQPNYFEKIIKILDCSNFDKSLPINTFVKIYDIEEKLVKYLINNVVYYNNKFKISLDKDKITFGSICLANIPIDETYNNFLDKLY